MNLGTVSAIIPTLDEAVELPETLASLDQAGDSLRETLVVDGGSRDGTRDLVRPPRRLLLAPRGRAIQLNAGGRAAIGDVLLFVHADCRLPRRAADRAAEAVARPGVVGGAFHKRFRSRHPLLAHGVRPRTAAWHALGAAFGDQAMFVRRDAWLGAGGFSEDLLAEDLDLWRRLRPEGCLVLLDAEVSVSGRRLERCGVLRTWAAWWRIALRHYAGRPLPAKGNAFADVRTPSVGRRERP